MTDFAYSGRELEVLADLPGYYDWIVESFQPHLKGAAAEFGAGLGTISGRIRAAVERLDLIEPSADMIDGLKGRFAGDPAVRVFQETQESFARACAAQSYDTIVMVNVLEHIDDDAAALRELRRLLRAGGHLLVFVPALGFLYSEFDRRVGHHRRYHREELRGRATQAGFAVRSLRYFDMAGVVPWWLFNTLGGQVDFNPAVVKIFDRAVVPVLKRVERVLTPPFGKNLLLVAEAV